MTTVLSVRNLSTTFATDRGVARAVDDVSLDLLEAETLGIVGESGSGKTVTALSLLRLIDVPGHIADTSVIEFGGRDLMKLKPTELRRVRGAEIAMVFQEPTTSLNPVLTVGSQIAETVLAHESVSKQQARARAVELLELVGLPDPPRRINDYPHQLSGGMQQRVLIAMALSCNPAILIADEPTTALDVTIQAQILELLAELKQRLSMAMILITHDLGIVAGVADRVAVMYGGQIVEQAATASLFDDPQHPYTRALLRSVPRLDKRVDRLEAVPGAVPPATDWPAACRFHPRCPHAWDRCRSEMPTLLDIGTQREVRCWLAVDPDRGLT
jgi:peptide/nickel transport system ATP-binding protein/oligopeptide transport system ATP-binding protein